MKLKTLSVKTMMVVAMIVAIQLTSCTSDKSENKSTLAEMNIEIPESLKNKPEVVSYINGMTEVANDYAHLVEDMLEEYGEYAGVKSEDLSVMEQIKLTKATAEVTIKSVEIMEKWSTFQDKRLSIGEQLTDDEALALQNIWTAFEKRFDDINKKQEEMFAENASM